MTLATLAVLIATGATLASSIALGIVLAAQRRLLARHHQLRRTLRRVVNERDEALWKLHIGENAR